MTKRKLSYGISAFMLIFALLILGCDNPAGSDETDTWSTITSFNQVNGTWKGGYSEEMSIKESMERQGMTWTSEMQNLLGNMRVSLKSEVTMTINASAKTLAGITITKMTFSGGNINIIWPEFKEFLKGSLSGGGSTVTTNDSDHSAIMTDSQPAQIMTNAEIEEFLAVGFQINQTGTKLRTPANYMGFEVPELTFIKQ